MKVLCRDLGKMDYAACWELQRSLFDSLVAAKTGLRNANPAGSGSKDETATGGGERTKTGNGEKTATGSGAGTHTEPGTDTETAGTILLVEHPPVYTLGKSGHAENLLVDRPALERLGARFFHIDRGGDITFHGPGQLVCYPILDLERLGIGLRDYIDRLEEAVIRTVARYGIAAGRIAGASGVWLGEKATMETGAGNKESGRPESPQATRDTLSPKSPGTEKEETKNEEAEKRDSLRKICAIGVRSSRYVTMHGFALNVTTDLGWFSRINPCGFSDRGVTSIARETGRDAAMDEVKRLVLRELEEQLGIKVEYENRKASGSREERCFAKGDRCEIRPFRFRRQKEKAKC